MRPRFVILACIVALALAAIVRNEQAAAPTRVEASARPPPTVPPVTVSERDRDEVYSYYGIDHPDGGCPAGLVKKVNGCVPVGGGRGSWAMGQPLPSQVIPYPLPAVLLGQITPPPYGYRYARVGDDVLIIASESRVVVGAIAGTVDDK
ncbi:MAG TPA: hypothetical protein VFT77_19230 [Reyranella sp.]|nr:hypothetical protein [Reyranella sp.]